MKTFCVFVVCCFVACGCASTEPTEMPDKLPRLIEQEPFPSMSEILSRSHHEFDLKLQIGETGNVLKAEILNPTGDQEWDSLALLRIGKWKFSPAFHGGRPIRMWITVRACVKCEEPVYVPLAELVCPNSTIADSVYALLSAGADFQKLVAVFSVSKSKTYNGNLGEVDIHRYAENVQKELLKLKENECSPPLALGDQYVIFKRLVWDVKIR